MATLTTRLYCVTHNSSKLDADNADQLGVAIDEDSGELAVDLDEISCVSATPNSEDCEFILVYNNLEA